MNQAAIDPACAPSISETAATIASVTAKVVVVVSWLVVRRMTALAIGATNWPAAHLRRVVFADRASVAPAHDG